MRSPDDLTMYVYGLLDPKAEEEMRDHLQACPECAELRRRIAVEHKFLKGALGRDHPELPAWVGEGHRRRD